MRVYILGVCGTLMSGIALLARQLGHEVRGCDEGVYPPMSDVLREAGIPIDVGYLPEHITEASDVFIVGNAVERGNPALEHILNKGFSYISGPQWLAENALQGRHVLAISGTHGKTTTSSMLAWVLEQAGEKPGYLIGGVPYNFEHSAALGDSQYFVIEADEYDTSFYDKRSKFMHYRPRTLLINNIEFDHADIFSDVEAIKKQFQYLLRTVPAAGTVISPGADVEVLDVLSRGCWSEQQTFGRNGLWHAEHIAPDGSMFELWHRDQKLGVVEWKLLGMHNVNNALATAAAAHEVGVGGDKIIEGLKTFQGVKRRLEVFGVAKGVTVYDDFAHHPTAIASTLAGLRAHVGQQRIFAVLQFGSNTMRMGIHADRIAGSLKQADRVLMFQPASSDWNAQDIAQQVGTAATAYTNVDLILDALKHELKPNDNVLIMSNKGFERIHQRLLEAL